MDTDPTTEPLDDPDVPVFLDDPDLRLPRLPTMISEEFMDEFREKFSGLYASPPSKAPKQAEPRTPRRLKEEPQRPERFQDGIEPIFIRGGGPCWPLPLTISHTPADEPLDTASHPGMNRKD